MCIDKNINKYKLSKNQLKNPFRKVFLVKFMFSIILYEFDKFIDNESHNGAIATILKIDCNVL